MTISEALYRAATPGKKAAAKRRLNIKVAEGTALGLNKTMIKAGIKAHIRRLANKDGRVLTETDLAKMVGD